MIGIHRDTAGSVACGRSGLPLLAICSIGHNRLVPFHLLKTSESDWTPLYSRPFRCKACGSRKVVLFSIESHAELDVIQRSLAGPRQSAKAPTTHSRPDPDGGLL